MKDIMSPNVPNNSSDTSQKVSSQDPNTDGSTREVKKSMDPLLMQMHDKRTVDEYEPAVASVKDLQDVRKE